MSESEVELVKRMQLGDAEAFDRIFERYNHKLLRMAYLISGNYADSEDIVQEAFVTCYCNCKSLKDCSSFSSWLYRILTRTAWRYAKKRRQEEPTEVLYEHGEPESGNLPLEVVLRNEEQSLIYAAVNQLEMKQRTVIVLYYFNQLSTKEIGRVMGCMEGTVKSRLYTARKNLEQSIKEEGTTWRKQGLIL